MREALLCSPDTLLKVRAGLAFATFSKNHMAFPPFATVVFKMGSQVWSSLATESNPLSSGMGPVPYATMGFLASHLVPFPKHIDVSLMES